MVRTVFLALLFAAGAACSSGRPMPSLTNATAPTPTAQPSSSAETAKPADPPAASPCDFKVLAMSDPAQKQIRCANGESFVVRRGDDGKWHEEMKVRAGLRPAYATPEEAARARCCPPAAG
jgi:hypothetical protein